MRIKPKNAFSLIELSIVILIIGILVGGIVGGILLANRSRISAAKTLTQSSPVIAISDLSLWLETTSEKSFLLNEINSTAATKPISSWFDINPTNINKLDATQGTALNQPTYVENVFNGLPVIRFDGSNSFLVSNFDMRPTVILGVTGFVVFKHDTASTAASSKFLGADNLAFGRSIGIQSGGCTIGGGNLCYYSSSPSNETRTITTIKANTWYILSWYWDDENGKFAAWVNGVNTVPVTSFTSGTTTSTTAIGKINPASASYWDGDLGELIFFNRILNNSERQDIEKYLSKKWGIKLN